MVVEPVGTNQTYTAGGFIGNAQVGAGCSPWLLGQSLALFTRLLTNAFDQTGATKRYLS